MFDESPAEAWRLRFGTDAPVGLPDLGKFLNHRCVRQYKPDPIPEDTMKGLIGAAQSAATSSNLQMWSVVTVQDPERREAIGKLCDPNPQIRTASWFLCFLADHYRLRQAALNAGEEAKGLDFMEYYTMAAIDAALAAERLVCAAEALGIGVCYIGGLRNDPKGVKDLLGLPEGVFGVFGLCLGWPAEPLKAEIKPRLAPSAVCYSERYNLNPDVDEYNPRMSEFYVSQGMKGDFNWSSRSGRRVDEEHLTGRESQKAFLEAQGFAKR